MPRILAAVQDARLVSLPWGIPLADWPKEHLVALPRGISRHVVRFIRVGEEVYAAKEVLEHLARHEYRLLQDLHRVDTPSVEPFGIVTGRIGPSGERLDPVLLTKHLQFSLPYRSLFTPGVRQETVSRLLDAMVVLLVRLHLIGFLWGDVSLSNCLFRRDAGSFAAHLVDAETGELHQTLTRGQREHDLSIARTNLFGEFCDLEAGGLLDESLDPQALVESIETRYRELWSELTGVEEFDESEMHRIEGRVRKLNELGFDVAELDIVTDFDGSTIRIQPKVVDAGHHSRRLLRLTGLDTEENQARRLLNDLDTWRARSGLQKVEESIAAHQWLINCFEPVTSAIPVDLRGKRDSAEIFHEVLDHRWYRSETAGREIPMLEATQDYVDHVLAGLPDEQMTGADAVADTASHQLVNPFDPSLGFVEDNMDRPYDPWEDDATDEEEGPVSGHFDMAALRAKFNRP